ncbi:FUSC family protein [Gelidibacter maritimus]|uniref:FUSC family protein n=1 Tax=Gelidibacter maritimus TaxID=2761487 RepID=A0A7W2R219_9FLAO|nr:FUSC family protein [Gelidibacter maritimus]MBA6151319.1 FUSC family protein [Gelidibacter maritimus]
MRSLFIVLGIITAVLALILAVTPLSQIAYIPAVAALIFGFVAFYISKRTQMPRKTVQLIFILTIISLVLTIYKSIFNTAEVGNMEELELKKEASMEDSKEILEGLEIDEMDLDSSESDALEIEELPDLEDLEEQ